MAIFEGFSKRKKASQRSGQADVYSYDALPQKLKVQIVHIWKDALGENLRNYNCAERWEFIEAQMSRELGVLQLRNLGDNFYKCVDWFLNSAETDQALDMIELTFRIAANTSKDNADWALREQHSISVRAELAVEELNARFRENEVGYQFEDGQIIRVDDQFVHSEVIKPALSLLSAEPYNKAKDDFLTAHKHYREGHTKDCIVAANRAFESTLKAICKKHKWKFADGDSVGSLVTVVRTNGLFPQFLGKGLDAYVAMLKTGLPDVRNNAGGHGSSPAAPEVDNYFAAYALHMTAANILLLVTAEQSL